MGKPSRATKKRNKDAERQKRRVEKAKAIVSKTKGSSVHEKKTSEVPLRVYSGMRVLILGDGDLSFSVAFAKRFLKEKPCITATSYDSVEAVLSKYGQKVEQHLCQLDSLGCVVRHGIDGTRLSSHFTEPFDAILFNFPHTGQQRVHLNRNLITSFFRSASQFCAPSGVIWVTTKSGPPYCHWNLDTFASDSKLERIHTGPFHMHWFPGYRHATTDPTAKRLNTSKSCLLHLFRGEIRSKAVRRSSSRREKET